MMLVASLVGLFSVAAGLVISYHANTSGSATMAVTPIVIFFVALSVQSVRGRALIRRSV